MEPRSVPAEKSEIAVTGRSWWLLRWGVVVGPFYLSIGLAQALLRDGFDLRRHSLSVFANGPGGWVQTANFVISGAMVLAAAAGLARALRPTRRAAAWFLASYGLSMIAAAMFRADPVDGFPPGTPPGMPASISTSGLMHFAAGGIGFLSLALSGLAAAWTLRGRGSALARLSLLSGLVVLLGFFSGAVFPPGVLGTWIAVVVGWLWLAVVAIGVRGLSERAARPGSIH